MKMPGRLAALIDLIPMIETSSHPLDADIRAYFKTRRYAGSGDRRWTRGELYAITRHYLALTAVAGGDDPRRILIVFLRLFRDMTSDTVTALFSDGAPHLSPLTDDEIVLLESVTPTSLGGLTDHQKWNLSPDLGRLLNGSKGFEDPDAFAALGMMAPVDIRVNTLKTNIIQVLSDLAAFGIDAAPCDHSPVGIRLTDRTDLKTNPLFVGGKIDVQDEGSQLLARLGDPKKDEVWLDYCAGAGGKSLALSQLMENTGSIYATDIAPERLAFIHARAEIQGMTNIHVFPMGSPEIESLKNTFHGVFVDAPCTGTGTLRRHPEKGVRFRAADLETFCLLQKEILEKAASYVAPGGRLIYGTCSFLQAENDDQIDAFLKTHPDFAVVPVPDDFPGKCGPYFRAHPNTLKTDGFFGAILIKNA